jgi:hypothetical protein
MPMIQLLYLYFYPGFTNFLIEELCLTGVTESLRIYGYLDNVDYNASLKKAAIKLLRLFNINFLSFYQATAQ